MTQDEIVDTQFEETTNPDEQVQNSTEEVDETTTSSDPLDDIQDMDALRAEAKKLRAIAQRKEKKPAVIEKEPEKEIEYVTKADMAKLAVNEAKEIASEEVLDNWDELLEIPLAGYDKLDAKSIAKNMEERLAILKARNPQVDKPDTTDLTTTKVEKVAGEGKKSDKKKNPLDDRINLPKTPDEWY